MYCPNVDRDSKKPYVCEHYNDSERTAVRWTNFYKGEYKKSRYSWEFPKKLDFTPVPTKSILENLAELFYVKTPKE